MNLREFPIRTLTKLSNVVAEKPSLKKASQYWNTIESPELTVAKMSKIIDSVRHSAEYYMSGLFNCLPTMKNRSWTKYETIMFYIYIDAALLLEHNAIDIVARFHIYSGRSVEDIVFKADDYQPLYKHLSEFKRFELVTLVQNGLQSRDYNDDFNVVLSIYQSNRENIEKIMGRQMRQEVPLVNDKNKPIGLPKKETGYTPTDLINRFNKRSNGKPKKKEMTSVIDKSNSLLNSSPFTGIVVSERISSQVTKDDLAKQLGKLFKKRDKKVSSIHPNLITGNSEMMKISSKWIPEWMNIENVIPKVTPYADLIKSFKSDPNKNNKISELHDVIIILIRAKFSSALIAELLGFENHWPISKYITEKREEIPDLIRNGGVLLDVTKVELDLIRKYLFILRDVHGLCIVDSIFLSSILLDLSYSTFLRILLENNVIVGSESEIAKLKSTLMGRTRLIKYRGYVKPEKVDVRLVKYGEDIESDTAVEVESDDVEDSQINKSNSFITMITEFINQRTVQGPGADNTSFDVMYKEFCKWCRDKNSPPLSQNVFTDMMNKKGHPKIMDEFGTHYWKNIRLYNEVISETDNQIKFKQKCNILMGLFPNINVKQCIPLVNALLRINPDTNVASIEVGDGRILTFDHVSEFVTLIEDEQNQNIG